MCEAATKRWSWLAECRGRGGHAQRVAARLSNRLSRAGSSPTPARSLPKCADRGFLGQQIVDCGDLSLRIEAEVQRRVRLRIDVDETHALPGAAQRGTEIHRGRRFADAAFLVDDGDAAHGEGVGCQVSGVRGGGL